MSVSRQTKVNANTAATGRILGGLTVQPRHKCVSSEFGIQKANDFCTECIKNKILNVSPLNLVILSILNVHNSCLLNKYYFKLLKFERQKIQMPAASTGTLLAPVSCLFI